MISGFKEFLARGNAVDLAVGVIIGGAFGTIVSSLVDDVINPLIGALFGQPDFSDVGSFTIALMGDPAVVRPGAVITAIVNFLIVALALYLFVVLPMNKLASLGPKEEPVEELSAEAQLLVEIRDELKNDREEPAARAE